MAFIGLFTDFERKKIIHLFIFIPKQITLCNVTSVTEHRAGLPYLCIIK